MANDGSHKEVKTQKILGTVFAFLMETLSGFSGVEAMTQDDRKLLEDHPRTLLIPYEDNASKWLLKDLAWCFSDSRKSAAVKGVKVLFSERGFGFDWQTGIEVRIDFFSCIPAFVLIPPYVKRLPERCFERRQMPLSFAFEAGSQLEKLGESTFLFCHSLRSIAIPAGVKEIATRCFAYCRSLDSVTFEAGSRLEKLGDYAFSGANISCIVLPAPLERIGTKCFAGCRSLSVVVFAEDCHPQIGERVFYRNSRIRVVFSDGAQIEGWEASAYCARYRESPTLPRGNSFSLAIPAGKANPLRRTASHPDFKLTPLLSAYALSG
jgi:hypothetical protein